MNGAARRGNVRRMTTNTDDDNIEIIGSDQQMASDEDADGKSLTDLVEQPAKVMRIGTMIKQLLEEVRAAPLDDASRNRLREIHNVCEEHRDVATLKSGPFSETGKV